MPIGEATLKALEFHKILDRLADCAATSRGRAKALALLPATDFEQAQTRLLRTGEALAILRGALAPPFGGLSDIESAVKRAALEAALPAAELARVGNALCAMRRMKEFFAPLEETAPLLCAEAGGIVVLRQLEEELEKAISPDGELSDQASPELFRLRRQIRATQERVREELENLLRAEQNRRYFQDQLVTMRGGRYVIPVKQEYRRLMPGIVHDHSGSGATVFIEPLAAVELNNEVKKLRAEEQEETERILKLLSLRVGGAAGPLLENLAALTRLDLVFAKARLALLLKAVPPELSKDGRVDIVKGRHPLIRPEAVTPVDARAGGGTKTLVITGSNAGGKTVTLKIIGLFALMAQSGLFLPAGAGTRMPVFPSIYADIGDEQSIEQDLSTFSGQIKNIAGILEEADGGSLVLLDEICAGTDPREGAALAMAVLENLRDKGATTVLTTHYGELKVFAFHNAGMENASVEFDPVSLKPTYRLLMGTPGSSNALSIAARIGLAPKIIARAETFVGSAHKELQNLLAGLENERKEYERRNLELEGLRRDAATLWERAARRESEIAAKKRDIIDKCREQAAETLRQARLEAEEAIKAIKALYQETDGKARQTAIDKARRRLFDINLPEEDEPPAGRPLTAANVRPGQWVYVPSLRQKGIVLSAAGEDVTLRIGILRMSIAAKKCVQAEQGQSGAPPAAFFRQGGEEALAKAAAFKSEIDVRGKTVEEAILELDKYIDDAALANASQVRVIHGKGAGALRRGLDGYFGRHPLVRAHELAAPDAGGSGATILFL
ncbi:MAG: endonuclease MutS2 [Acidaminococcales bacterium]|jgi:DNA mismatch repair protein MutS2|nr:endonuclease MutS2 [Acidaminococcales bacterium]